MAKLSEKETKDIERALLTGDGLPSGYELDFSKNPPYRKYTDAELAEMEKAAVAERKRADALTAPDAPAVPNAG